MAAISSDIITLLKIIEHRNSVSHLLKAIARKLEDRADVHDISKLSVDEFVGFCQMDNARKYEYGSEKYEAVIRDNNAVELHLSQNRHHPEYWPNGIDDMNIIDIIEMLCDWEAARQQRDIEKDINKTWQMRKKRFNLSDNELLCLRFIWDKMEEWQQ